LDSQSVKTTQVPGIRGYDRGKRVKGRKRHLLVDTLGLLLVVVVTAASVSENAGARLVLSRLGGSGKKLRRVRVDAGYRGTLLDWAWEHCRLILKRVLRPEGQKGFVVQAHRWVVERTFAWITRCRRLSMDYEVLPASSEAWIYLAMIRLMLRRLARECPFSNRLSGLAPLHYWSAPPPPPTQTPTAHPTAASIPGSGSGLSGIPPAFPLLTVPTPHL
jgi:putative transposase